MTRRHWLVYGLLAAAALASPGSGDAWLVYTVGIDGWLRTCGCDGQPLVGMQHVVGAVAELRRTAPEPVLVVDAGRVARESRRGRLLLSLLDQAGCVATLRSEAESAWASAYDEAVARLGMAALGEPVTCTVGRHQVVLAAAGDDSAVAARLRPLRPNCDLVVLLSNRPVALEQAALAGPLSGLVDLVVGCPDSTALSHPLAAGGGWVLPDARLSDAAPAVRLHWPTDGPVEVDYRPLPVATAPPDEEARRHIEALLGEEQREVLQTGPADAQQALVEHGYAAPEQCAPCHKAAYDTWRGTAHAGALAALVRRRDVRPECLACHAEAFRRTGRLPAERREGEGVECASCHDGAAVHLALPEPGNIGRSGLGACRGCHDPTDGHVPALDAAAAWKRIAHGKREGSEGQR